MRKTTRARLTPRQRKIARILVGDGTLADFARAMSREIGKPVGWTTAYNWIQRGLPKRMVLHAQKVTGARLEDLLI